MKMNNRKLQTISCVIFLSLSLGISSSITLPGELSINYYGNDSSFASFLLPESFAQTSNDIYRGSNYTAELLSVNLDGTENIKFTQSASILPFVQSGINDSKGRPVYIPYLLEETDKDIKFESGNISWIFHKETCTASLYSGGIIFDTKETVIENISWTLQENNGVWLNSIHNNYPCVVTITELPDDNISLLAKQGNDSIGYKEVEFKQKGGKHLESWYRSPIADSPNKKYGFSESHVNSQDIIHNDIVYGINVTDVTKIPKGLLTKLVDGVLIDEEVITKNPNGKIKFNGKNTIHDSLTDVTIQKFTNTKLQSYYDFHDYPSLNIGERLEIDPTYSSSNPTEDSYILDSGNNDLCDGDSTFTKQSTEASLFVGTYNTGSGFDCGRSFIEFDITSIPAGSNVSDTTLTLETNTNNNGKNCDILYSSIQPSVGTDSAVFGGVGLFYRPAPGGYADGQILCGTD